MSVPTLNRIVSVLRCFFTHTLHRPDLARKLVRVLPILLIHPGRSFPPLDFCSGVSRWRTAGPNGIGEGR